MKYPYKYPLPFPSDSRKDNVSGPFFFEPEDSFYPFPLPLELFAEVGWPKSICIKAHECDIDENDLESARECEYAQEWGCPLFLSHFSEFAQFGECENVELFEIGQDESKNYTQDDLKKIVDNFEKLHKIHRVPTVVLGHDEDQSLLKKSGLPSAGWVKKLWTSGKKLFANLADVPEKVVTLLRNKAYRFPSIEVYRNFSFDGTDYGPVLRRVALCGADIPRIKSLDDIIARYDEGGSCLPVSYSEDRSDEILWLGGEIMKKITVAIKSKTGKFKKGEKVSFKDSKISGTLIEESPEKLVVEVTDDARATTPGEEVVGADSGAIATLKGKEPPQKKTEEFAEVTVTITGVSGKFKEGEAFTVAGKEVRGKIAKIAQNQLTLQAIGSVEAGDKIVGTDSKATATVGKEEPKKPAYPYPSPYPEKKSAEFTELEVRLAALEAQLAEKDSKIDQLERLAEHQQRQISLTRDEREKERRNAHIKDVERFMEKLKSNCWAPAFVDESGLMSLALSLDWNNPVKFSEKEDPKSHWEKFTEIWEKMSEMQKENKLFIPDKKLPVSSDDDSHVPEGFDEEGHKLDLKIQAYMKEHPKVTYEEAFEEITKNM